tara:strand:- start:109 stop:435 length:327 start_codon:yes stop_codon:yes gene_type:complete
MSRRTRIVIGALLWIGAAVALYPSVRDGSERMEAPTGQLWRFATHSRRVVEQDLPGPLAVGDPILSSDRTRLGAIVAIGTSARATWELPDAPRYPITIAFDPEAEVPA